MRIPQVAQVAALQAAEHYFAAATQFRGLLAMASPLLGFGNLAEWWGLRGVGLEWKADAVFDLVFYFSSDPGFGQEHLIRTVFAGQNVGIDIKLRVTGEFVLLGPQAGDSAGANYRDPQTGLPSGTLAGRVVNAAGERFYLSCNHVFFLNGEVIGPGQPAASATILSPAKTGAVIGNTVACDFCKLTSMRPNLGDWALARIPAGGALGPWAPVFDGGVTLRGKQPLSPAMAVGKKVFKRGATTRATAGRVIGPKQSFHLRYPALGAGFDFTDQLRVAPVPGAGRFAEPGDSGSLVITEDGDAVGLVFSTDTSEAMVCPLEPLFTRLQLSFDL